MYIINRVRCSQSFVSSLSCSSLIPLSKRLFSSICSWFGALQMSDSKRCCVRQSRPPAGVLWSRTVQRSWPLHDDWPAAVWACMNSMLFSHFWTVVVLVLFSRSLPISRSALAPQPSTAVASCHFSSPSCLCSCLALWLLCKICGKHKQRPCSVCFIYCKIRLGEPLKKNNINPWIRDCGFSCQASFAFN